MAAEVSPHQANTTSPVKVKQTLNWCSVSHWGFLLHGSLWILNETDSCIPFVSFYERSYTSQRKSQTFRNISIPLLFFLSFTQSWWIRYAQQENDQAVHKTQRWNRIYTQMLIADIQIHKHTVVLAKYSYGSATQGGNAVTHTHCRRS